MTKTTGSGKFFGAKALVGEGTAARGDDGALLAFDSTGPASCNGLMPPAQEGNYEAASFGEEIGIEGIDRSRRSEPETLSTGIAALDRALEGGLSTGVLSEVVSAAPSSGGQTVLLHLLEAMRRQRRFVALVDGGDAFDPQGTPPALLEHLLWARCGSVKEAMAAADVLLRDENLGMALVDLRGCDRREVRRVKSTDWYRLQRLAGQGGRYVCVFTEREMIPAAQTRVVLDRPLSLTMNESSARDAGAELAFRVTRLRRPEREEFPLLVEQRRKATG